MVTPKEPDKDAVWMNCQASSTCDGKQAKIVFKKQRGLVDGGGQIFRYRCLKCDGVWHIIR